MKLPKLLQICTGMTATFLAKLLFLLNKSTRELFVSISLKDLLVKSMFRVMFPALENSLAIIASNF